ncbi:transposase [Wolbachia endosymbiont (group B) of Limnophora tigrina]|uniref:transposase n=1 Tax=Wolbachia endosymbiont (group B) of Limnophora tigrina TaxID=3139317 RepID=UPI0035B5520A
MLSKQVIATKYSNGVYSDHYGALGKFDVKYAIKALYADRAYDRKKLYKLCNQYGIKTKIPPKNNSAEHPKLDYMLDRNAAIQLMELHGENGIKRWKEEVNYGKRSYIEGFFSRLKEIFGFSFKNKSETNREKELLIKCYLMNKFTAIGVPKFEIVA